MCVDERIEGYNEIREENCIKLRYLTNEGHLYRWYGQNLNRNTR